ncbi:MAG TPA: hypothetical protein VKA08_14540 [Balneolales bacterium]|nr:hypothetical protein [Balneolales bacterium]
MKPKLIFPWLLILVVAGLAACQNNGFSDQHEALQWFPNKVGDSWTYAVTDTAYGHRWGQALVTDTLRVSIIGTTKYPDGTPATIWQTVWPKNMHPTASRIDTTYVILSGDSVLVSPYLAVFSNGKKHIYHIYVFPFQTGNGWRLGPDSSRVVSRDTLSVPAGTFTDVYRISTGGGGINAFFSQDTWFKAGIGIVQVTHAEWNYLAKYTWKLLDYHVK